MSNKKQLTLEIDMTKLGKEVAEVFESSAASRIQLIRDNIVKTRSFLDEVSVVYRQVMQSYFASLQGKGEYQGGKRQPNGDKELAILHKNGKIALVLLSANRGLYGDLPLKIVEEFGNQYKKLSAAPVNKSVDIIVVGRLGQFLLENFPVDNKILSFTAFPLDDDNPSNKDIQTIIDKLVVYEEVFVSYGKFQSLLTQVPETVNISGGNTIAETASGGNRATDRQFIQAASSDDHKRRILFEPSLQSIAAFFEQEVLSANFQQLLYEMQLARLASRMVAMDGSVGRANELLNAYVKESRKLKRETTNRKLQQIFAGQQLW